MNFTNPQKIIAPPPTIFLFFFFVSAATHYFFPFSALPKSFICSLISIILFVSSLSFVVFSFFTMRKAKTSPNPFGTPSALVTHGPFAVSRNPIYLAMVGFYLSGAFLLNSGWIFAALPALILLMNWGVIQREEVFLETQFGDVYKNYRVKVRRWI